MSCAKMLGAAAAVAIFAAPVLAFGQAQTPMSGPGADINPPTSASSTDASTDSAPSAQTAGMNTSGVAVSASQLPPDQARALAQGDNTLVTNGPVPDTAANRAKYGKPMSHAGKKTPPAGN
jgi:hypothetical protein